jgi:RNase P/RNase MRP subunit POP5
MLSFSVIPKACMGRGSLGLAELSSCKPVFGTTRIGIVEVRVVDFIEYTTTLL